MSEPLLIVIIAGVPSITSAILSFISVIISRNHTTDLSQIKVSVDGKLDKFISLTKSAAVSEGRLAEQSDIRNRTTDVKPNTE
jgi:hypothetical protein